jgi:hypothetical protein
MKLLARIAVLLAAALVVVGAMLAFGRSGFAEPLRSQGHGQERAGFERRDMPEGGFAGRPEGGFAGRPEGGFAGRPEGGRGDRHGPSLFGLAEVAKQLVKIAIIIALVVLGARLLAMVRDRAGLPATRE